MKRSAVLFVAACLVLVGMAASTVRADSVWYYQTFASDESGSSSVIWSSAPSPTRPMGGIELVAPSYGSMMGSREVTIVNLRAFSSATLESPDLFANAGYHLSVAILDVPSMTFGVVSFTGALSGILTHEMADISNRFTGETTQTVQLGSNFYTISLRNYAPPGSPSSGLLGAITAFVSVTEVHDAPEPSSLVLGGLGCALLGFVSWRKRRVA
jgi:hypothetical protein